MCLLIAKPANQAIPAEYLHAAAESNPHGCGIAVADAGGGKTTRILKSAKWGAEDIERELEKLQANACLVHFRYATHGALNDDNTHPFSLPGGWSAAHNGIIHGVTCGADESDTRAFLREHVEPYVKQGIPPTQADFIDYMEVKAGGGNKLAFLSPKGEIALVNEKAGHWKDGVWYSNDSYATSRWHAWTDDDLPERVGQSGFSFDLYSHRGLCCDLCGGIIRSKFAAIERNLIACADCVNDPETREFYRIER